MPRITAPRVNYDQLEVEGYPAPIRVGSPAWFDWLKDNRSFHYEDAAGKFTACKESRSSGMFWYANRRVSGKLRRCYLGATSDLTLGKLNEVARQLSVSDRNGQAGDGSTNGSCVTDGSQSSTTGAEIEAYQEQVRELQRRLDHERTMNAGLQSQLDNSAACFEQWNESLDSLNPGDVLQELRQRSSKPRATYKDIELVIDIIRQRLAP
jgi:hypothetical protein